MLRRYSNFRTFSDNIKLGALTALSAGMVNVVSVISFFAFTSNVTGHYAILAQEFAKGNWYQAAVVFIWIALFFLGNFTSNFVIIHSDTKLERYIAHAIPIFIEILCLFFVGLYLILFYKDTLQETEFLIGTMLYAMGIQNGLTATISNFAVKTTHLTGLTTDLGILLAMFTQKKYRENNELVERAQLLLIIMVSYVIGGIIAGLIYYKIGYFTYFLICGILLLVIGYDNYKLRGHFKRLGSRWR